MNTFREFLDCLDTPGGHIALFVGLICLGMYTSHMELTAGSIGALYRAIGSASAQPRANGQG